MLSLSFYYTDRELYVYFSSSNSSSNAKFPRPSLIVYSLQLEL